MATVATPVKALAAAVKVGAPQKQVAKIAATIAVAQSAAISKTAVRKARQKQRDGQH